MEDALVMTGTFGWTHKVDWDKQAQGMNHRKIAQIQAKEAAAKIKMKQKQSSRSSRSFRSSRWGTKLKPLEPLVGLGSRSIHHYFATSPTVKHSKHRVDDPVKRRKRLDRRRKIPKQKVDNESPNSGCHEKYHQKRMFKLARPKGQVSIKYLDDHRDESVLLQEANKFNYFLVSKASDLVTVLHGPLSNLSKILKLLQTLLLPLQRSNRMVSDDFEILSRHFPDPVQVLNTRTITSMFTRKSHCDAFTPVLRIHSTSVDQAHGKTSMIMYPDEQSINKTTAIEKAGDKKTIQESVPATNTIIIRMCQPYKNGKKKSLLQRMNKIPLAVEKVKRKPLAVKYARGASTNPIVVPRKHPSQTFTRGTRCTYEGSGTVDHVFEWGFQGVQREQDMAMSP